MKKLVLLVTAGLLWVIAAGCGAPSGEQAQKELIVFAAASMTECMDALADIYAEKEPGVTLVYNFDSSGTLKTQIEEGAACDVFISAGQKQMDQLEEQSLIEKDSRFDLVCNRIVLIVPKDSDKGISSFEDTLTQKVSLLALGGPDVPVGQYSVEIFESMGVWDELKNSGKISYGSNVKEVLSQVESAAADCGVVYETDAAAAKGGVDVAAPAPESSHSAALYPAAAVNTGANSEDAKKFLDFLKGPEACAVFEEAGFTLPAV